MTVRIAPETEELLQALFASGDYPNEAAAVDEAVRLLQQRDELRTQIRQGLEELDRGERIPATTMFADIRCKFSESHT